MEWITNTNFKSIAERQHRQILLTPLPNCSNVPDAGYYRFWMTIYAMNSDHIFEDKATRLRQQ